MGNPSDRKAVIVTKPAEVGPGSDFFDWRTFDPSMLPEGPRTLLARELATYQDRLDEMLADHEGEFAVIQGDRIAGYHGTRKRALEAAHREFAREPALIKQVVEKEPLRRLGGSAGCCRSSA